MGDNVDRRQDKDLDFVALGAGFSSSMPLRRWSTSPRHRSITVERSSAPAAAAAAVRPGAIIGRLTPPSSSSSTTPPTPCRID